MSSVCFEDLYNLRAPVGTIEGFDVSAFDKRVRWHKQYILFANFCIVLGWKGG